MSDVAVLTNTAVAVLAAVVLIVRFRVNPVIALVIGSVYLGLAVGLGVEKTVETITAGFGEIMVDVGLLIAFGVLMGSILNQSGAIRRLVEHLLNTFGPKRLPYTMGLAIGTVLQSIFLDVLLVISAPLARKLAPRIGKLGTARMATAMAIALECGIVFTVPGVASLALAGLLNVPLGKMLLFGLLLVIPTIIISIAIMTFLFRRGFWNEAKDEDHTFVAEEDREGEPDDEEAAPAAGTGGTAPTRNSGSEGTDRQSSTVALAKRGQKEFPLLLLFAPLLTSLLLIGAGAILQILEIEMPWLQLLGEPVIALLIGLIGTALVTRAAIGQSRVEEAITIGFKESGQILILTGVGGSLAATVAAAGLGDILGGFFSASTVAPLLVVWAIAAVLHIAVGSVTLSAITAAGLLAPIAPAIGLDPVLLALAAGAGSLFMVHVTSNTFWLLQSLLGQSVRGALKSVSVGVSVASVVAILLILPMSLLF
ncbi:Gluconate transporter [Pseudarthrobacter chlorophenolicus A6]|uniref:Gluconate transporter n=1 Tax=Pseudarthrobacter chlorophenolicus (strain ATCC 700700 / DSM 12829 / CIP 107037 / JCM 12360 / KCTC 9906 / NCIMB 13794 / A6) TaxID=452863 RepID=B8H933_PSECP|nr:SLC13 family permease [Pseudarthrobacter chlorophenolicus]ACL38192.1 Gluconate transporter [Pseudarthrobacter chlorophenolicus A6]SDQ53664.1 H+/gluconate symporter [Pseudarthrobacter chlorophenolicus]